MLDPNDAVKLIKIANILDEDNPETSEELVKISKNLLYLISENKNNKYHSTKQIIKELKK